MELVGRRREQQAVRTLLDRVAAGPGAMVVLVGPSGAGTTALADASAVDAEALGFVVRRCSPADLDLELGQGRGASGTHPTLLVVDEPDAAGDWAPIDPALIPSRTAIIGTARRSLGAADEVVVGPMTVAELAGVAGLAGRSSAEVEALWLASGGRPGSAVRLAVELDRGDDEEGHDPVVALALVAASSAEYLDIDPDVVRLLEAATARTNVDDPGTRARLLARLAYELLGDSGAADRRRRLADEALELARRGGDAETLALVLDARLHALWGPGGATDRLATAAEIIELAGRARDREREQRGRFWRFVALVELGRVGEAEVALAAYERSAPGDPETAVVVAARQAALAVLRGRYELAGRLIDQVDVEAHRLGLADADRLVGSLRGSILFDLGPTPDERSRLDDVLHTIEALALRLPGHFFETVLPVILVTSDRPDEATAELERQLPAVLAGSGPRWLSALADLAWVAAAVAHRAAAGALYERLTPYRGELVVRGGANTIVGPIDYYLGRLAQVLDRPVDAVAWFDGARDEAERMGALPWVARAAWDLADSVPDPALAAAHRRRARSIAEQLGAPFLLHRPSRSVDGWSLTADGDDWLLVAGEERARLRDTRGVAYLRALLGAPGSEISALDLVAGGAGLVEGGADDVLDDDARRSYQRRLDQLDADLDAADRAGDADRAAGVDAERHALLDELRRATGLGGRSRAVSGEAERARVNVTRTLRATLDRITAVAPRCGAHLQASIHTGRACRYQPDADGPPAWRL